MRVLPNTHNSYNKVYTKVLKLNGLKIRLKIQ